MKTIAEFRASKRRSEDLGEAIGFDTGRGKVAGWIYADTLYIEDTATWNKPTGNPDARGPYYLLLDRSEWFSDTIEPLETRLYAWWLCEYIDGTLDDTIINDALDAACKSIQDALGITSGDKAAHHFGVATVPRAEFEELMTAYVLAEAMS